MFEESKDEKTGQTEIKLVDLEINDPNTAFNVIIHFVTLAQKRGVFSIQESAKIWEALSKFIKQNPQV